MPRLIRILKWTALALLVAIGGLSAWSWIYANTPLGCYIEEEYPPLKPGTPEYAAMQVAARQGPQEMVKPSHGRSFRAYIYTGGHAFHGRDRIYSVKRDARGYWFITFHPTHQKSILGCDQAHLDGSWTAIVRKSDLSLMNPKGEEFN